MFQGIYLSEVSERGLLSTLAAWKEEFPDVGVLALVPEADKGQIGLLQAASRNLGIPLLGAVFPALLTGHGFVSQGLTLLKFDNCPPWLLIDQLSEHDATGWMSELERVFSGHVQPQAGTEVPTLFFIFDGLLPNINTLLHRVHKRLGGSVRYAGVNAGSESFQPMPCLFDHEREIQNGCIALLAPATSQFLVEHCYPVSKAIFRATSSTGNRIDQIDGKPAMAVYQALMKAEFGFEITPENFYQHAVHYPFGLVTALDVLVRIPVGLTEDGAIHCVGEIPANAILKLLRAPEIEASGCAQKIASSMHAPVEQLVAFYCAGRRMHFGEAAESELHQLTVASHSTALYGALTLGEIGTDADLGFPVFHNAALVCIC